MKFSKKVDDFLLVSSRVFSKYQSFNNSHDVLLSFDEFSYHGSDVGRKNIISDFRNFSSDFRKVTNEANLKVKHGKTTTSK